MVEVPFATVLSSPASATGNSFTDIGNNAEEPPFPQAFTPRTVRLPEVAFKAKLIVMLLVEPFVMVAPLPEYVHT